MSARIDSSRSGPGSLALLHVARGLEYEQGGDYGRAIADFDRALEIQPENAVAFEARGDAHYFKGDYDRAIADYGESIRLAPGDASVYFARGVAYLTSGRIGRALCDWSLAAYYYVAS